MHLDDLIILSIDDHTVEPPDLFDDHLPGAYKDRAPRLVRDPNGKERWEFEGKEFGIFGLNATVSWPKEEWGLNPSTLAEMRPAAYLDRRARPRHEPQRRAGVDVLPEPAGLQRPPVPGGRGQGPRPGHAPGVQRLAHRRVVRIAPGPVHPAVDRAGVGHGRDGRRDEAGGRQGLPRDQHARAAVHAGPAEYQSDYWDPFFRAVCDEGLVMCLHIGMGLDAINMGPDFSPDNFMVLSTQVTVLAVQDLLWGPALRKYPELKVAFSEGGIGWIPFLMDRVDRHYVNQRWTGQDFGDEDAERGVPRALAGLLHLRPDGAQALRRHRHRHHRLRDRLPALRLAVARRPRGPARTVRRCRPLR